VTQVLAENGKVSNTTKRCRPQAIGKETGQGPREDDAHRADRLNLCHTVLTSRRERADALKCSLRVAS